MLNFCLIGLMLFGRTDACQLPVNLITFRPAVLPTVVRQPRSTFSANCCWDMAR